MIFTLRIRVHNDLNEVFFNLPEHDSEGGAEGVGLLFQQVGLRVTDEIRLPQQVPLLGVTVKRACKPEY